MSTENESCNYVLRCGKNKGSRCANKISKKCPNGNRCWTHIVRRLEPLLEEVSETKPTFLVVSEEKNPDREEIMYNKKDSFVTYETVDKREVDEKLKLWEERFLKEQEHYREEQEYRAWKNKRMARPVNIK